MLFKNAPVAVWILSRMGVDVSGAALERSFFLRSFVHALNFLLTWGLFVVITWSLQDERNALGLKISCAVIGSAIYGLLIAAHAPVTAPPDDH